MNSTMSQLRSSLARILGPDVAGPFVSQLLAEIGLREVRTPEDLFQLGEALCARSSDVAVAGHSAKVHALLHGAAPTSQRR